MGNDKLEPMTTEPKGRRRARSKPSDQTPSTEATVDQTAVGAQPRPATAKRLPLITVMDCTLGISRRYNEIILLLVIGIVLEISAGLVILVSGITIAGSGLTKTASAILSVPGLWPFKLSFDRFTDVGLLKGARETLERGLDLSVFMREELTAVTGKKDRGAWRFRASRNVSSD